MTPSELAAVSAEGPRRPALAKSWQRVGTLVLGWIAFVLLWAGVSHLVVGPFLLPPPLAVAGEMWGIVRSGEFVRHFQSSLLKVFAGFLGAVLIGTPIGYLMGKKPYWKAFFQDPVTVAGSIPGITYAFLALVVFGISASGPILAVSLISMPYIAINVAEGLEGVDQKLISMSHAFRRSEKDILKHVLIPSIMPFLFAGIRLSFALAWKVEQLTEVFGSSSGIGFKIRQEFEDFSITGVLSWVLLFIGFMLVLERLLLARLEQRVFRWRGGQEVAQ